MNFQAIVIANLFGVVLLISLLISRFMTRQHRRLADKMFLAMTLLALFASIIEVWAFWIDGRPGTFNHYANLIGCTYLYSANIIGCFLWTLYVDLKLYRDRQRLKAKLPLYAAIPLIAMTALIVNLFTGFLFYVDENNVYHREPLCVSLYLLVLLTGAMSIAIYYIFQHKHGKVSFFPVWMFMLPAVVGSVAQGLFYGISVAWPSTAIGISALYMSLQNEISFIDPLTGLYNRLYLEHILVTAVGGQKKYYGMMLDLNFFKKINDTYGHSAGDRALADAGQILRRAMTGNGSVFRFAGDEFVIMLETDSERDVLAVEKRIRTEAKAHNSKSREPYELNFSMGHARLESNDTEDLFLRKIDRAMYKDKERMHTLRVD